MPCNSNHMLANDFEKNLGEVYLLLDELEGRPFDSKTWKNRGYDKRVYYIRVPKGILSTKTKELCSKLQEKSEEEIKNYSLSLQVWWREHQDADKERLKKEHEDNLKMLGKQEALAKLTPYERKLLGF